MFCYGVTMKSERRVKPRDRVGKGFFMLGFG